MIKDARVQECKSANVLDDLPDEPPKPRQHLTTWFNNPLPFNNTSSRNNLQGFTGTHIGNYFTATVTKTCTTA